MNEGLSSDEKAKTERQGKQLGIGCLVIIIVFVLWASVMAKDPVEDFESHPPAAQLAAADSDLPMDEIDPETISEYRSLFNEIRHKTKNSVQKIVDISYNAQDQLKKKGVSMDMIDLLRELNEAMPDGQKWDYAEIAAAYVLIRAN